MDPKVDQKHYYKALFFIFSPFLNRNELLHFLGWNFEPQDQRYNAPPPPQ